VFGLFWRPELLRTLGALRREGSCGRFAGEGADRLLSSARPTERRVGAGAQRSFMTSTCACGSDFRWGDCHRVYKCAFHSLCAVDLCLHRPLLGRATTTVRGASPVARHPRIARIDARCLG